MTDARTAGAVFRVSDSAGLASALAAARPGDEIRLAGGGAPYKLDWKGAGPRGVDRADVVITSDDPDAPARLSNVTVAAAADLTFRGLHFVTTAGNPDKVAFDVVNAARITVEDCRFDGPARGWLSSTGAFSGKAATATNVDGFRFEGNHVEDYSYALQIDGCDDVAIEGNSITGIQVDGIQVAETVGVRIAGNAMWDFHGVAVSRAHADFIQFWTKGATRQTRDIVIEDNLLWASGYKPAQMIFVNNEKIHNAGAGALNFLYQNLAIRNNVVINDNPNAIFVHGAANVDIVDNAVFNKIDPADRRPGHQPAIRVLEFVRDAEIVGNVAPRIAVSDPGQAVRADNVLLSGDPASPAHPSRQMLALERWRDDPLYREMLAEAGLIERDAPRLATALTVSAAAYDAGPAGVAYGDAAGLQGGEGRGDGDVEHTAAGDVGWIAPGDWLSYTVHVEQGGLYDLALLLSAQGAGGGVAVSFTRPGEASAYVGKSAGAAAAVEVGAEGFVARGLGAVRLDAGTQTMRVRFEDGAHEFRAVTLARAAAGPEPVETRIGDLGTVSVAQDRPGQWRKIAFETALDNPVVVMGPLSAAGDDPATVRVRNVTAEGFEFQIDEWNYLDGRHVAETVSWMAVEAGRHVLADGTVIEARSTSGGAGDKTVGFGAAFAAAPVVLTQVAGVANPGAVITRASDVGADRFVFRLQEEEEGADGRIAAERVDWIAISRGIGAQAVSGLTGAVVTHEARTIGVDAIPDGGVAGYFAAMQTMNGADAATLRVIERSGARARLFVEEERSMDPEMRHAGEAVGWVALGPDAFLI